MDKWKTVASLEDFEATDVIATKVEDKELAIYLVGDVVFATDNICSHGNARLCDGFLEGYEIECPFHQGRFDIRTGEPTGLPARVAINSYAARVEDGKVQVQCL
jgi:Ferredoxin subunits of nitrite reductase and ring-hydroxylating dioxygenases